MSPACPGGPSPSTADPSTEGPPRRPRTRSAGSTPRGRRGGRQGGAARSTGASGAAGPSRATAPASAAAAAPISPRARRTPTSTAARSAAPERTRACRTCGLELPWSEYRDVHARQCEGCRHRKGTCRCCGGPTEQKRDRSGHFRAYCDRGECQAVKLTVAGLANAAAWAERARRRRKKRCPCCGLDKPLTAEHWYFYDSARAKPSHRHDAYCIPCRRADQNARYKTSERRKASARARAARQREQIEARRAADPEFDREYRAQRNRWSRERKARLRAEAANPTPPPLVRGGPKLPAPPLAEVLVAAAERDRPPPGLDSRRVDGDQCIGLICERAGVPERTLHRWRYGEVGAVQLAVADQVLQRLDLLWFDVWPPERFPEVAAVMGAA